MTLKRRAGTSILARVPWLRTLGDDYIPPAINQVALSGTLGIIKTCIANGFTLKHHSKQYRKNYDSEISRNKVLEIRLSKRRTDIVLVFFNFSKGKQIMIRGPEQKATFLWGYKKAS